MSKFHKEKIFSIPSTKGMSLSYKIKFIYNNIFQSIRSYFQRARNGYSHSDVWDIDLWFSKIIVNILEDLIENGQSYPEVDNIKSYEEWQELLRYMRFCFLEANEETCSRKNEIEVSNSNIQITNDGHILFDDDPQFKKWCERENELTAYRHKMLYEGLDLFKKWYYDLWD